MLFHAHLLHSDFADQIQVPTPSWLMHEARDAWMQNARDDVTESRSQKELAAVVELLGLTYEVEHPTEDGYFSIDIALPNQRTALEFDGPSHFMNDGANTKSAKTELRDLLLQKRGWRVVSVPYFEWIELNKKAQESGLELAGVRRAYVKGLAVAAPGGGASRE